VGVHEVTSETCFSFKIVDNRSAGTEASGNLCFCSKIDSEERDNNTRAMQAAVEWSQFRNIETKYQCFKSKWPTNECFGDNLVNIENFCIPFSIFGLY
jgi:hypothetical protein